MNHREVMRKLLENFSDEEIMHIYGAKEFQRDLAEKFVRGVDFLFCGEKIEKLTFTSPREHYTEIQPKIKIGDVEVNAPYRVKPDRGSEFWVFSAGCVDNLTWYGDGYDDSAFNSGNCFKTEEDARAARDAISKLLNGE